ncbi:toll/interleukin-1 receptor domain-containing protein [Candidatus Villigracilis affinis]|uniref:toll/interleukin-1 receptor domain-containing protein n=1 Tax=Candidatus Villigracilis affinis TaxID=3140682 RepID=UPI001D4062D6|nr:TIR domain-containing protein [Anaerolineales bacterium]MBL0347232.1 TIR domain-containing protein [Anaerolineales bacterium]
MTKNIFMSYSRRELGFVDDLVSKLEAENYNVWLDYRVLIPGSPWDVQIEKGLNDSDTVLLVVSNAALASKYVTSEWRHFLDKKQRVILLIFEAVDLPKELEQYEWVDFRGSYKAGLSELFSQLQKPIQEDHPVPETGFKSPLIVWVAIIVSAVVAILSIFEWWTLFIPLVLFPLPYKIYKRNFNFTHVQAALAALPFASLLSVFIFSLNSATEDFDLLSVLFSDVLFLASLVFGLILLFILRSSAMQRWGRPEAIIPKYINPQDPKIQNPIPIPFYVDYVFQDRVIAEDLIAALKKYGHPQAENIQDAKAVFALISQFKSDTEAIPEKQMLFPILVQTNNDISKKLSKIQWIDFRPGVRGLDTIAQLLPDPKALLKSLGMRPVSSQSVYSPTITAIYYFIIFLAVVNIGSALNYLFDWYDVLAFSVFVEFAVNFILFFGLAYFIVSGLTSRKGIFSSLWAVLLGVVGLALLTYWQKLLDGELAYSIASQLGEDVGFNFINYIEYVYYLGIAVTGLIFLRNRRDVKQWFPAKK